MSGLLADSQGAMWMTSINTGLFYWREDRLSHKPLPPELPMRGGYALIEDQVGWFWMISNNGILRARKREVQSWLEGNQPAVAWQVFGVREGLPAVECNGMARDDRGRLWVSTDQGVAWVHPADDPPNLTSPPVRIEELTYHRTAPRAYAGEAASAGAEPVRTRLEWPIPAKVILPPGSRRAEIRYTAFDFTAPEQLRFQIKLEPGDGDWQNVGNRRTAYYYDFNPGHYVFHVRAMGRTHLWTQEGARLAFIVQPHL
jgi:hypothetical protein